MKEIVRVAAIAIAISGETTLGEAIAAPTLVADGAYADGRRACYRKCRYHNWSAGRCLRHCRERSGPKMLSLPERTRSSV